MKKFPSFDQYSSLKEFYQKYDQVKRAIDEDPLYQRVYEIALKLKDYHVKHLFMRQGLLFLMNH